MASRCLSGPGGASIDLAIGVAMGVAAWDKARVLGDAANTGIHVDDALLSQGAADAATFEAVLATVFAALGAAAAGLRPTAGLAFSDVRRAAPTLELSAQVRVARVPSANPRWLRAGADIADIDRAIAALGSRMRFEEMQLLRRLVYGVDTGAIYPPTRERAWRSSWVSCGAVARNWPQRPARRMRCTESTAARPSRTR